MRLPLILALAIPLAACATTEAFDPAGYDAMPQVAAVSGPAEANTRAALQRIEQVADFEAQLRAAQPRVLGDQVEALAEIGE